jgi:hypothetical protein
MGISAVDKFINLEKLSVSPSLSIKTGKKQTVNVKAGNVNIINQAYMGTTSSDNPDLIAEKGQKLIQSGSRKIFTTANMELVLSPYIGVIKSPELPGTRFHLEFAVINNNDRPKIIKGAYVKLNRGLVHFKRFFKVNGHGSREPDLTKRFPIVVASRGARELSVEFENLEQSLIKKGSLKGELYVLIGNKELAKQNFTFEVNDAMVNTLNSLQQSALKNKVPLLFDAMIKS